MYCLIKNIDVRGANALSAYPVVSGVSPLSIAGFVRSLAIALDIDSVANLGFAPIHHLTRFNLETFGFKSLPVQRIGAIMTCSSASKKGSTDYSGSSMSLALQPVVECNTRISVVIDFEDIPMSEERIMSATRFMRIAGGQIQSVGSVRMFEEFDQAVKRAGAGYVYLDRTNLMDNGAESRLMDFVNNLYPAHLSKDHEFKVAQKKASSEGNSAPFMVPFNLGWLPLTDFKEKPGARKGVAHAFVEPLIGLVEMVSARKAVQARYPLIWKHKKSHNAYVVSTDI